MNLEEIKKNGPFAIGGENVDYAQYFDGTSYLNMISLKQVVVGNVTFEAGCRNHWHIHHATKGGGQMLLVTAGRGWYQVGETGPGAPCRRRRPHPGQRQALARCRQGQCLPASGHRSRRDRYEYGMV